MNLLNFRKHRDYLDAWTQDSKNRQNSLPPNPDNELWWSLVQQEIREASLEVYSKALGRGIAKEVARVVLPEGLTPTHLYMAGTLRSWIHFLEVRCDPATQLELRQIAQAIKQLLEPEFPDVFKALQESS